MRNGWNARTCRAGRSGARAANVGHGYHRAVASNPGVPSRTPRERAPRGGDTLSGPADYSRPSNPWPRLLAFGGFVLAMVFLGGLCLVSFLDTPDREIRVRHSEYEEGLPKFLPVTAMGFDGQDRTYGAFLAVPADSSPALALLSRDPDSGCNVLWEALGDAGDGRRGIYTDPCSEARYGFDGGALHASATSNLHRLDVVREVTGYVVSFEEIILGACLNGASNGCSPAGETVRRALPKGYLPADFGQ